MATSPVRVFGVTVRPDLPGIHSLLHDSGDPVMQYMVRLGSRVLNNAAARVPVDTGYLRSTGTLEERPDIAGVRVAYRAHYARFVHEGTSRMTGRPWLTEALNDEVGRL